MYHIFEALKTAIEARDLMPLQCPLIFSLSLVRNPLIGTENRTETNAKQPLTHFHSEYHSLQAVYGLSKLKFIQVPGNTTMHRIFILLRYSNQCRITRQCRTCLNFTHFIPLYNTTRVKLEHMLKMSNSLSMCWFLTH